MSLVALFIAFVLAGSAVESAPAVPRFLCYPVMPGDTAAAISRRLTRDPQSWRGSGFQFFDPATAMFVPKANYGYLHRGWQACIAEPLLVRAGPLSTVPDAMGWWVLVLVCGAAVASLMALQWSLEQRTADVAHARDIRSGVHPRVRTAAAGRAQFPGGAAHTARAVS